MGRLPNQHTKIFQSCTVEIESVHGGSANGGLRHYFRTVGTPLKVIGPMIRSRMKQPHRLASDRITSRDMVSFHEIAALTSTSEVLKIRFSARSQRCDVFDRKGTWRERFRAPAVFAV